jgi:hypothetical protein
MPHGMERKRILCSLALLALMAILYFTHLGHGQEMTEKYIPIDAYPRLAGKYVTVGVIMSVDERKRRFVLRGDSDTKTIQVLEKTKIWLDRSLRKEANQDGTFADLKAGLKAEVRVLGPKQMTTAKWVKVQITVLQ